MGQENKLKKLDDLRREIDQLDVEILRLISQRASCAQLVGELKRSEDSGGRFYRPEREAEVLRKILAHNQGPLRNEEMARLVREIMSACLALEHEMCIAFLGPEGTYTEEAALKHFGHSVKTSPLGSIEEVFREVESRAAMYGVVPIENSTEGVITHTLDNFIRSPLKVTGEVALRIHHHLLSTSGDIDAIERVYSHQQSFAQCRNWLDTNLRQAQRRSESSNARAAMLAAQDPQSAAIASRSAAEKYGLSILHANIEDMPDNTTRFLIIGEMDAQPSGNDKTSLLVSAPNQAGSLYKLLEPFARNNVSLTRIESRPSHCVNWEYVFFLDVNGHKEDTSLASAIEELRRTASMVNILGSYPKAVL